MMNFCVNRIGLYLMRYWLFQHCIQSMMVPLFFIQMLHIHHTQRELPCKQKTCPDIYKWVRKKRHDVSKWVCIVAYNEYLHHCIHIDKTGPIYSSILFKSFTKPPDWGVWTKYPHKNRSNQLCFQFIFLPVAHQIHCQQSNSVFIFTSSSSSTPGRLPCTHTVSSKYNQSNSISKVFFPAAVI